MVIYYSEAIGRANVSAEFPVNESVENTLNIFRSPDRRKGFLSVELTPPLILQLLPNKNGVRIELLNSALPAIDLAEADVATAEQLINEAANGCDVFKLAHQLVTQWEHLHLG